MTRTGLLLAAGASRRFGAADKLLADLHGRPLIVHAVTAMRATPLDHRIAVIANPALLPHLAGFHVITITGAAQSDSLRAGLDAAGDPDRLLIVLGDMPDVTAAHLSQVLAATTDDLPAASHNGRSALPPACFPRAWHGPLGALTGDQGAGRLLRNLPASQLIAAPGLLRDIDRPEDL
ncbi:MAG: nucleotidyltransferase family protein [Paracoccus sp. (in: a-proteobacteria)]